MWNNPIKHIQNTLIEILPVPIETYGAMYFWQACAIFFHYFYYYFFFFHNQICSQQFLYYVVI